MQLKLDLYVAKGKMYPKTCHEGKEGGE